jgi:hypothetical protein
MKEGCEQLEEQEVFQEFQELILAVSVGNPNQNVYECVCEHGVMVVAIASLTLLILLKARTPLCAQHHYAMFTHTLIHILVWVTH